MGANKTLQVLDLSRIIPTSEYYQYDPGHLAEELGNMLKVRSFSFGFVIFSKGKF